MKNHYQADPQYPPFGRFTGLLARIIMYRIAPIPEDKAKVRRGSWLKHLYWSWRLASALPFGIMLAICRTFARPKSAIGNRQS